VDRMRIFPPMAKLGECNTAMVRDQLARIPPQV
jgi:hypothetical protein